MAAIAILAQPPPAPCVSPSVTIYKDPSSHVTFNGANTTLTAYYNFSLNNSGGSGTVTIGFWLNATVGFSPKTYAIQAGANTSKSESFFLTNVSVNDFSSISPSLSREGYAC